MACMTMVSFRIDQAEAAEIEAWAANLGIARSELLRDALRRHLAVLRGQSDADKWGETPLTAEELAIGEIADWGPAEDWSDWNDAAR